jgi:hypothetical protein
MLVSEYSYQFNDASLFTTISHTPNITNAKNDFAVWGQQKGNNLPIHVRYALDVKPTKYVVPIDRYSKIPDLFYIYPKTITITDADEFKTYSNLYVATSS